MESNISFQLISYLILPNDFCYLLLISVCYFSEEVLLLSKDSLKKTILSKQLTQTYK